MNEKKLFGKWPELQCLRSLQTILGEYCQSGIKYDHLMIENLPYRPLYFSRGSKRLETASKHSDFIVTMFAFNCLYIGHFFPDRAEIY